VAGGVLDGEVRYHEALKPTRTRTLSRSRQPSISLGMTASKPFQSHIIVDDSDTVRG
jgi:hypothetical protein